MTNRKNDTEYHEVLRQLSICVYDDNAQLPAGYRIIDRAENKKNGFYAIAYSNGKDTIIAYRGTNDLIDGINDLDMAHSELPKQYIDALNFHDKVARENPNSNITVTGHSLGGSLAEAVSAIRGTFAVTFNAYGIRDMFSSYRGLKEDNIVNYLNETDWIAMANGHNHLGEIYSVPNIAGEPLMNKLKCHYAESMGDLSQRIQKTPAEIKEKAERIHPKVIKGKDIYNKTCDGINIVKSAPFKVKDKIVEVGHKVIHKASECVGSYYVNEYTRKDGTKVDGYTRTCGAKHYN